MTKRLVDIDDDLLHNAREILQADTMKETVNRALAAVVDLELRRRHAARLATMDGIALDEVDLMASAWE